MRVVRRMILIAAVVSGQLLASTVAPASASNLQTVCNSVNSATWVLPAYLRPDGSYFIGPHIVDPGECLAFDNHGGRGRIFIPTFAGFYAQGQDGRGYQARVYRSGVYSNPVNDPVHGINRYKTGG